MTGINLSCPPRVCVWAIWINILQTRRLWGAVVVVFNSVLLNHWGLKLSSLGNHLPYCALLKYYPWVPLKLLSANVKASTIKIKSTESSTEFPLWKKKKKSYFTRQPVPCVYLKTEHTLEMTSYCPLTFVQQSVLLASLGSSGACCQQSTWRKVWEDCGHSDSPSVSLTV